MRRRRTCSSRPARPSLDTTNARVDAQPRQRAGHASRGRRRSETPISWRARAGRVGQRAEEVEDRAHGELLAHRDDVARRLVVGGREHEAEADLVDAARHRRRARGRCARRAPRARRREPDRPVAERLPCLATRAAGAGGDQRGGGRDVERRAPAAGAGGVEQVVARRRAPAWPARASCAARPASSSTVSPFVRSAIRKAAICASRRVAGHDLAQHGRRPRSCGEVAGPTRARRCASGRGRSVTARKFASSCLPSSVSTDSGWNCTPSAGSSRWRMPMSTPPPLAVTSKHVGQRRGVDDQRVVAPDGQRRAAARRRSCGRRARSSVVLPCTGSWRTTVPPKACASAWWPRHTPSVGTPASGKRAHASSEMPASSGVHGPGRDDDAVGPRSSSSSTVGAVVAHDLELGAQLAQVLDEVVGEGVVVVDDEDAHHRPVAAARTASSIARSTPPRLGHRLLVLVVGLGVGDGAAAGLDVGDAVLDHDGADVDAGVEVAGVAQVADRAAVAAALDRLELVDDLHRADLRRAATACPRAAPSAARPSRRRPRAACPRPTRRCA